MRCGIIPCGAVEPPGFLKRPGRTAALVGKGFAARSQVEGALGRAARRRLAIAAHGKAVASGHEPRTRSLAPARKRRLCVPRERSAQLQGRFTMSFFPAPNTDGRSEHACLARHPAVLDQVSFARSEFDQLNKYKLRREMCREQGSLCVHCERKIVEGRPVPRIDHRRLLSLNPRRALRWRNLCLPCPSDETCDSAAGNRRLRRNADEV